MTTDWALISDNLVDNVAVAGRPADSSWLASMRERYDAVVDVTAVEPRPGIGWTYENGAFTPPQALPEPDPPIEP